MEMVIDGYHIQYKITGAGEETVVILQGWGTELSMYDFVASCINEEYKVIQLDFPGFGNSDEPREPWAVNDYADFFVKFSEKLDIKKATLIGHSYGGRVIIKLANRSKLPFVIDRIVLVDSAGILPQKTFVQKIKIKRYKLLKRLVNLKFIYAVCPELIDEWKNKQGSADYRNASPMMKQCLVKAVNEDLTDLLSGIGQETLLIWGENDTATPLSDAKVMEKLIPDAGLAVIPKAGHFCFFDQPVIFKNILKSYFNVEA